MARTGIHLAYIETDAKQAESESKEVKNMAGKVTQTVFRIQIKQRKKEKSKNFLCVRVEIFVPCTAVRQNNGKTGSSTALQFINTTVDGNNSRSCKK